jgi:hypothetical protein
MKASWLIIVVVAIVAYLVGVKYPNNGAMVLSKVGL